VIVSNVIDLAYGTHHACMLATNGWVTCHGKNERNQLGSSTDTSNGCGSGVSCSKTPLAVEGFTNFVQIDAGTRHTVGLLDNGSVVCWGINDSGECGMGSTSNNVNPPAISTTAPANVLRVFANGGKTCVVTNQYKTLHCTGSSHLGNNSSSSSSSFVEVQMPSAFTSNHRILDVSITSGGACIYSNKVTDLSERDMFCWGSWEKSLGAGTQAMPVRAPIQISAPFN
jgi:hypothetical protein